MMAWRRGTYWLCLAINKKAFAKLKLSAWHHTTSYKSGSPGGTNGVPQIVEVDSCVY